MHAHRWLGMSATRATVEGDDAAARRAAAQLLTRAGFQVGARGAVVCLLARGSADERLDRIEHAVDRHPGAWVVASMPSDTGGNPLRRALRGGVHGIVLDDRLDEALAPTIHAVLAGQLVVPPGLRRLLAPQALSHREKQIMRLVVAGYTNQQIARELYVAQSTVKTHLSSAFAKLHARSRAEAAALVLDPENGYGAAILDLAA
jgi:DNA-binding NarL/FixJ family response regulator